MAPTTSSRQPMKEADAASYIGMSVSWLRKARMRDDLDQPAYLKIGSKAVRYHPDDLDAWMQSRRRQCAEAA